jgi:hypothetical protein
VFDAQGDWPPVVSGEATVVEKSTECLMLDAGEEKRRREAGDYTKLSCWYRLKGIREGGRKHIWGCRWVCPNQNVVATHLGPLIYGS